MTEVPFDNTEQGGQFRIWGEFPAVLSTVEVDGEPKPDKNGNMWVRLKATFKVTGDDGTDRTKMLWFSCPYDLGDGQIGRQVLDLAGKKYSEMKEGKFSLETDDFKNKKCTVIMQAEYHTFGADDGKLKTYDSQDKEGNAVERISYAISGVHPTSEAGKIWTGAMEEKQKSIFKDFNGDATPEAPTAEDTDGEDRPAKANDFKFGGEDEEEK